MLTSLSNSAGDGEVGRTCASVNKLNTGEKEVDCFLKCRDQRLSLLGYAT